MTWTEGTEKHARAHKTFRQRHFRRAFGLAKMFLDIYFFAMLSLATPGTVRVREWNCARHFLDSVKTSHKCFCQNCLHYFTFLEVKRNIYQLPNTSNTLVKVRVQTAFFLEFSWLSVHLPGTHISRVRSCKMDSWTLDGGQVGMVWKIAFRFSKEVTFQVTFWGFIQKSWRFLWGFHSSCLLHPLYSRINLVSFQPGRVIFQLHQRSALDMFVSSFNGGCI